MVLLVEHKRERRACLGSQPMPPTPKLPTDPLVSVLSCFASKLQHFLFHVLLALLLISAYLQDAEFTAILN